MRSFLAALQFLTIFPLSPRLGGWSESDLGRSPIFFPLVGFLIGLFGAILDAGLGTILPVWPATVLVVLALLAVSRCLHMDGLADTADAFFSSRSRERMLEIMKDSRKGAMGVIAVAGVMMLKASALASVPSEFRWETILLMPLAGRCALVIHLNMLPYMRPAGGLGDVFVRHRKRRHMLLAALFYLGVALIVGWVMGFAAVMFTMAAVMAFTMWSHRKIGGFTGDTCGAACEVAELVPALVACSWSWKFP